MKKTNETLQTQLEYHERLIVYHRGKAKNIRERMTKLNRTKVAKTITISKHAIRSYKKRFKIMTNNTSARLEILNKVERMALEIGGNGKITIDGITYVLKNHVVVTIYDKKTTE